MNDTIIVAEVFKLLTTHAACYTHSASISQHPLHTHLTHNFSCFPTSQLAARGFLYPGHSTGLRKWADAPSGRMGTGVKTSYHHSRPEDLAVLSSSCPQRAPFSQTLMDRHSSLSFHWKGWEKRCMSLLVIFQIRPPHMHVTCYSIRPRQKLKQPREEEGHQNHQAYLM